MPAQPWGWLITPDELREWTLEHTPRLLAINKPGAVVCHPSKRGPWSSLVGACREWTGCERLHMPFRLDRETSGIVLFAKDRETAGRMQRAVEGRRVRKIYHAILQGEISAPVEVDAPLGAHPASVLSMRQAVVEGGRPALTHFQPLAAAAGYTLVEVRPATGRMHQIRVHAAHIGHPVAGDKIYGPDERYYLEFIQTGMTPLLREALGFERQALHCSTVSFRETDAWPEGLQFHAPLAPDMLQFLRDEMSIPTAALLN